VTNSDGSSATQAGSHPYAATTTFALTSTLNATGDLVPVAGAKDIVVALPPGLIGDPSATPQCALVDFEPLNGAGCPVDTQVGVVSVDTTTGVNRAPVYNMVPPAGMPARFAFKVITTPVFVDTSVRTGGDYGLDASLVDVPQGLSLLDSSLTFWGVPGDPGHNSQRCQELNTGTCATPNSFQDPVKPFLTLPTSCTAPQTTSMTVDSWEQPGAFTPPATFDRDTRGNLMQATGCDLLDFSPTISVQPDTTVADSPAGLSVDIHVPQTDSPTGLAEANLDSAEVSLPAGTSVSPSAADGLGACTPDEISLGDASRPTCPDYSKVGSVEIDTPVLPAPLTGSVFLAQQSANPFGSLLALYVVAEGDGVLVKLAGQVSASPGTGQLTATFANNPQLPFSDFKLDLFGGPRGALATPEACGTFTTTTDLTPWSGEAAATPSDSFAISSGCVSGFAPTFTAGVSNTQAGAFSPFALSFARSDTDQELSGLTVSLPPGLLAELAGVAQCSEQAIARAAAGSGAAEQQSPSCPAASQVGTVAAGTGPGSGPFFLTGSVYLTGPYRGGPYGLAVIVPALAGPFDLGTVVVRQAIFIDPADAHVTVVSDPFPASLDGIPLRIRRIDVILNRANFMVNPTSCDPMRIAATLTSAQGTPGAWPPTSLNAVTVPVSSPFQVGGCQALPFSPRLRIGLTGRGKTRSGDHPNLSATLSDTRGAHIQSARVTLPLSLALDPLNSEHVCDYDVALAVHGGPVGCPANTIVGTASAVTPLLSSPETGNVYLVQGIRFGSRGRRIRTLPSLLIPLRGSVALDLRAQTSVDGAGRLVTTFNSVPDVPVSSFQLTLTGGPHGLLVITGLHENICHSAQSATGTLGAHDGRLERFSIRMSTPCGSGQTAHRVRRRKRQRPRGPRANPGGRPRARSRA
jgi:hypothetical protein